MDEIIANVELHLLRSDFRDSMLPNTGFPADLAKFKSTRLTGPPILVEIVQMTEIGHSAFNLMSVRQTRIDRADLAGLERGDENEDRYEDPEDEGPIPKYPRSMLKLMLSDGHITIPAIEYRRLPGLVLGETPLGCKVFYLS
jgi:RecQ-mediated genome instability protein 1